MLFRLVFVGAPALYGSEWIRVRSFLPLELEESARSTRALVRSREITSGEMLLRVLLTYSSSGGTLEKTVALLSELNWASMTPAALLLRLRGSSEFLTQTLESMLGSHVLPSGSGRPFRIIDATSLSAPGAHGTDYRIHVVYDPSSGSFSDVEITDRFEGESLSRFAFVPGELVLGDRVYCRARGVHSVLEARSHVLVRFQPSGIRTLNLDGSFPDWKARERELPEVGVCEYRIRLPIPPEGHRNNWKPHTAIAEYEMRVLGARSHRGEAIWLLTDLSEEALPTSEALELYRKRWQIELFFKRLKSLANLDALPSRNPLTAVPWITLKLIEATLALALQSEAFSPWGYRPSTLQKPLETISRRIDDPHESSHRSRQNKARQNKRKTTQPQTIDLLEA